VNRVLCMACATQWRKYIRMEEKKEMILSLKSSSELDPRPQFFFPLCKRVDLTKRDATWRDHVLNNRRNDLYNCFCLVAILVHPSFTSSSNHVQLRFSTSIRVFDKRCVTYSFIQRNTRISKELGLKYSTCGLKKRLTLLQNLNKWMFAWFPITEPP
jgi:hypothetical protein